jgi:L-alanine-DL-glutamate epimerase-like enolase superfamily enzyme
MRLDAQRVVHRLREPLRTAWGELRTRVVVRIDLDGGVGEAAPLEPYDGVPLGAVEETLLAYAEVVREFDRTEPGVRVLEACRAVSDLPEALAAVDMALWDRAARREGRPVAALLTDTPLDAVPVNALGVRPGFGCVKLKVGLEDDVERVRAAREALGPQVLLRVDANGAWTSADEAVARIGELVPFGLELVEEPCHGTTLLREVRSRVPVLVAQDETAELCTDVACLKIGRCGGIGGLLARAALARAMGMDVYLASAFDGPVGIAAALHCAAALKVTRHCGLATLEAFEEPVPAALAVVDGAIRVPRGPGLLGD